jgi:hypothetical protein
VHVESKTRSAKRGHQQEISTSTTGDIINRMTKFEPDVVLKVYTPFEIQRRGSHDLNLGRVRVDLIPQNSTMAWKRNNYTRFESFTFYEWLAIQDSPMI